MKKKAMIFIMVLNLIIANLATMVVVEATSLDKYKGNAPSSIVLFTYGTNIKSGRTQTVRTKKIPASAKQVKAISSNKKVATVAVEKKKYGKSYYYAFKIESLKSGTASIKYTATVKGKKVTDYTKVTVVKYENPVSSFKIGNKDYSAYYNNSPDTKVTTKFTNKKTLVKCVPLKDWTVKKIDIVYEVKEDYAIDEGGEGVDDIMELKGTKYLMPMKNAVGAKVTAVLYNKNLQKTVKLNISLI